MNQLFTAEELRIRGDVERAYHVLYSRLDSEWEQSVGPVTLAQANEWADKLARLRNVARVELVYTPVFE